MWGVLMIGTYEIVSIILCIWSLWNQTDEFEDSGKAISCMLAAIVVVLSYNRIVDVLCYGLLCLPEDSLDTWQKGQMIQMPKW